MAVHHAKAAAAWQAALRGAASAVATAAVRLVYPPQCLSCDAQVTADFALCPDCWRETPFIGGLVCDLCGVPLPGEEAAGACCDECLAAGRPWSQGRAALLYRGNARALVLALKHGDRMDLAAPAGRWLHRAAAPLLRPGMVVAPVPLHWTRLMRRRYNQSALLAGALARLAGLAHVPDLLQRPRRAPSQDGRDRAGRFANAEGAFRVHPRRAGRLAGRAVLLVDDVLTSGATLAAATLACREAGAADVAVVALARVAKDG